MSFVSALKRIGQLILVPVVVTLLVFVLMALTYLLPTGGMKENTKAAFPIFEQEGLYYPTEGPKGTVRDNFIDAMFMDQAIVGAGDADLLKCVLNGYDWSYQDPARTTENLKAAVTDPGSVTLVNTEHRFVNGHVALVKLLLLVLNYSSIRIFGICLCVLLTALLGWLMYKRGFGRYILPLLLAVWFLRPLTMGMNIQFTIQYVCAIVPCILMFAVKKGTLEKRAWLFFSVAGAVMFCFNMNYFQLIGFGMLFMLYLLIVGFPEKPGKMFLKILDFFVAWMAGYAGAMVFKWAFYALAIDGSMFSEMFRHMMMRSAEDESSRLGAVWFNTKIAFGSLWFWIPEALFLAWTLWRRKKAGLKLFSFTPAEILLLVAMLLIPVGRLAILANHSYVHAWFTYRVFMLPVLACNLWITGAQAPVAPALSSR